MRLRIRLSWGLLRLSRRTFHRVAKLLKIHDLSAWHTKIHDLVKRMSLVEKYSLAAHRTRSYQGTEICSGPLIKRLRRSR